MFLSISYLLSFLHTTPSIRLYVRMCAFSNSMTFVTNLNSDRHPVKMGGRDRVQPLTAIALSVEENSVWKIALPPT